MENIDWNKVKTERRKNAEKYIAGIDPFETDWYKQSWEDELIFGESMLHTKDGVTRCIRVGSQEWNEINKLREYGNIDKEIG